MGSLLMVSRNWGVVAAWFLFLRVAGGLAGARIGGGEDGMGTSLMSRM